MLFTPAFILAQSFPPSPEPKAILRPQEIRSLPGALDDTLVFNSNSPEQVENEGILLSTLPPTGKKNPSAHLDFSFTGKFEIFTHHIRSGIRKGSESDQRTLYEGVIAHNPTDKPITIDVLQAASYLSQPDAPFIELAGSTLNNDRGDVYAGPGSRSASDVLRGKRQKDFAPTVVIPPGEDRLLLNLPIPVKTLNPPVNGRSSILRVRSTGKVYLASLALFAKTDAAGVDRAPTLEEWQDVLQNGALSSPRDKVPTPIGQKGNLIYGRVAGVSQGAKWKATLTDPDQTDLRIPDQGKAFSYGIATLYRGTLGTDQNQSAKMLTRYPDTAYEAHGNYAVQYSLTLPLVNQTSKNQTVVVTFETPIKQEDTKEGLRFYEPLPRNTFFRGPVRLMFNDDRGTPRTSYFHLVQKRGQQGSNLVLLTMKPGDRRLVKFDVIYPADATPPQVLTVKSL
jgi:hypothetical protein